MAAPPISRPQDTGLVGSVQELGYPLSVREGGSWFRHQSRGRLRSVTPSHDFSVSSRKSTGIHFCPFVQFRWPSPRNKIKS